MGESSTFVKWGQVVVLTTVVTFGHASLANGGLTYADTTSAFYPLAIGDYWEYFDYADFGGGIADTVSRMVQGDTTIGNWNYKVIHLSSFHYHNQWDTFERFDSVGDIYTYGGGDELLSFRFSDTSGTPWGNGGDHFTRWERNFVDTIFGMPRHGLVALTYQLPDTLGIFGFRIYLTEGLGMTANYTFEGGGYRLRGARIAGIVYGTITSVEAEVRGNVPSQFRLFQNYPNPFNPTTTISYQLPARVHVTLTVYDVLGHEVATLVNNVEEPGYKSVGWNASNVASGVYFYTLEAGAFQQTKKLVLIR